MIDFQQFSIMQFALVSCCCKTNYHELCVLGKKCNECKDPEATVCGLRCVPGLRSVWLEWNERAGEAQGHKSGSTVA